MEAKKYTQREAALMDDELDIVHQCLTELYDYDVCIDRIKDCLAEIEKCHKKHLK